MTPLQSFPLMDLPSELRELVYYHAMECHLPIDTAAIKNHGLVKVPLIAQLSHQTRQEALSVFTRDRELRLSLHCERNIERADAWIRSRSPQELAPTIVIFTGILLSTDEFFHITVRFHHESSSWKVTARRCASEETEKVCEELVKKLTLELEKIDGYQREDTGRLRVGEVKRLFDIVEKGTGWAQRKLLVSAAETASTWRRRHSLYGWRSG